MYPKNTDTITKTLIYAYVGTNGGLIAIYSRLPLGRVIIGKSIYFGANWESPMSSSRRLLADDDDVALLL